MSYINNMYGRITQKPAPGADKNPNRVSGGLRAQGSDRLTMFTEDGEEKEIPTSNYVRSLEEQVRKQQEEIRNLERRTRRTEQSLHQLEATMKNMRK